MVSTVVTNFSDAAWTCFLSWAGSLLAGAEAEADAIGDAEAAEPASAPALGAAAWLLADVAEPSVAGSLGEHPASRGSAPTTTAAMAIEILLSVALLLRVRRRAPVVASRRTRTLPRDGPGRRRTRDCPQADRNSSAHASVHPSRKVVSGERVHGVSWLRCDH